MALRPLTISTPTLESISSSSSSPHFTRSQAALTPLTTGSQTPLQVTGSSEININEEIRVLRRQLENTHAQRDATEVHAVMAQREAAVWKFQFNQKKEKAAEPSCLRLHTSSQ